MSWIAPAVGAVAGALGSRGGGSTTTTNAPWQPQQDYLKFLFEQAKGAYQGGELGAVAPFDPAQLAGQETLLGAAGQLPGFTDQVAGSLGQLLNATDVQSNPVLQQYIAAALRPLEQSLMQNVLPSIRGEALATGNFGGSRQGVAEGLGLQEFTRQGADVSTRILNNAYTQGLQAQQGAIGQAGNVANLMLAPGNIQGQVGGQRQAQAQAQLNQPADALAQLQALISGNFGGTTTTPGSQGNPLLGALGGAVAGNSLQNIWNQPPAGAPAPTYRIQPAPSTATPNYGVPLIGQPSF